MKSPRPVFLQGPDAAWRRCLELPAPHVRGRVGCPVSSTPSPGCKKPQVDVLSLQCVCDIPCFQNSSGRFYLLTANKHLVGLSQKILTYPLRGQYIAVGTVAGFPVPLKPRPLHVPKLI